MDVVTKPRSTTKKILIFFLVWLNFRNYSVPTSRTLKLTMSALDAVLLGNMTPSSDPAALLEVIAGIPSARPAALYTLSSVLTSLHLESTAASNGAKDGGGERGAKRQRTGDGGGAAEECTYATHTFTPRAASSQCCGTTPLRNHCTVWIILLVV